MSTVRVKWRYFLPLGLLAIAALWHMRQGYVVSSTGAPTLSLQRLSTARRDESGTRDCRATSCFSVNKCAYREQGKIGVYISPPYRFLDEALRTTFIPEISLEYTELLDAIRASPYYEPDPAKACITVPHIDTLNGNAKDVNIVVDMLNSLPGWTDGKNHILFVMFRGAQDSFLPFNCGQAMVAGGGFPRSLYRAGLDISIPVFNPLTFNAEYPTKASHSTRPHLLIVLTRDGSFPPVGVVDTPFPGGMVENPFPGVTHSLLLQLCPGSVVSPDELPWKRCTHSHEVVDYPSILLASRFCMVVDDVILSGFEFTDVMMSGCIPVVLGDGLVLPFSEVIDWSRASVRLWREELGRTAEKLQAYPEEALRQQVVFLYKKHFSSMSAIAMTVMTIIDERVSPSHISSYEYSYLGRLLSATPNGGGVTAVVVVSSKDQLPQVYDAIGNIAMATDLAKVLVVWTDRSALPPLEEEWSRIVPPITTEERSRMVTPTQQGGRSRMASLVKVVIPPEHVWNYRFFPYVEIDTAAVLVFQTDNVMLTSDDVQFAYKVWSQSPDRQVHIGNSKAKHFPPSARATIQHAYYHYHFTHLMPPDVADWLSRQTDCHDVAMELLIANYTGQPPTKVRTRHVSSGPSSAGIHPKEEEEEEDRCAHLLSGFLTAPLNEPGGSLIFDAVGHDHSY